MIYADGSTYSGDWANCKRNGVGKYVDLAGIIQEGKWKDDK